MWNQKVNQNLNHQNTLGKLEDGAKIRRHFHLEIQLPKPFLEGFRKAKTLKTKTTERACWLVPAAFRQGRPSFLTFLDIWLSQRIVKLAAFASEYRIPLRGENSLARPLKEIAKHHLPLDIPFTENMKWIGLDPLWFRTPNRCENTVNKGGKKKRSYYT